MSEETENFEHEGEEELTQEDFERDAEIADDVRQEPDYGDENDPYGTPFVPEYPQEAWEVEVQKYTSAYGLTGEQEAMFLGVCFNAISKAREEERERVVGDYKKFLDGMSHEDYCLPDISETECVCWKAYAYAKLKELREEK